MLTGHIGVAIGFLIIVTLLLWFVIYSRGKIILKLSVIAISAFYAVALWGYLPKLEGYPTSNEIPNGSILLAVKVEEPADGKPGAFYLWINPNPNYKAKAMSLFTPGFALAYTGSDAPRSHKLPYDKELHKKLLERQKRMQQHGGFMVIEKGGAKKGPPKPGKGKKTEDKIRFKIINPVEVLTKEQQ
jgi:hypothetical protein